MTHPTGAAVDICIKLAISPGDTNVPSFVILHCDIEFLATLLDRQVAVRAENLDSTVYACTPKAWDTTPGQDFSHWRIRVAQTDFRLEVESEWGYVVNSDRVPVAHMAEFLSGNLERSEVGGATPFRWVGGALLYAGTEIEAFSATVLARCPEIAARETELQMAERISSTSSNPLESTTLPAPRRRRGLSA